MNHLWRRSLALLLSLTTVLSLLPAGFALDTAEEPIAAQESFAEPTADQEDPATPETAVEPEEPAAPVEPETPAEPAAPVEPETPAEPAAPVEPEAPAASEEPAQPEESANSLPRQEVPVPSAGSYNQLTLEGTMDYEAAFAVQKLLNGTLSENGSSILMMDSRVLSSAMTRAAELAVCFQDSRPTGEDWSTVLGDEGVKATSYVQFISARSTSAQQIYDIWSSDEQVLAALTSQESRSVGIGCFSQPGGTRYWVLIVTNILSNPVSSHENVTGPVTVDYQDSVLGSAVLTLPKTTLNVGETVQASFAISNGDSSFVPAADMITYSSSSSDISVDSEGCVAATQPGSATITAALKGSEITATVQVTAEINLAAVSLSSVTNQNRYVKLTWKPVTGATHYQVYRTMTYQNWKGTLLDTVPASQLSYIDKSVSSGNTYYYTVKAIYNNNGTVVRGGYDRSGLGICYLSVPKLNSATASSAGITLKWGSVAGAKNYAVYRKAANAKSWTRIASLGAVNSYTDCNVTAKTKYTYTVRATSGKFYSYYVTSGISATATATVKLERYVVHTDVNYRAGASTSSKIIGRFSAGTRINVISGWSKKADGATWYMINRNGSLYYVQASYLMGVPKLKALSNAPTGLKISWSKTDGASGYYIYLQNAAKKWSRVGEVKSGSTLSYVIPDSKLTSGRSCTVTVLAYRGKLTSNYDTVGLTAVYLKAPALKSAVSNGKDAVTVSWNKVDGAKGYALYRKTSSTTWSIIANISSADTTSYLDTGLTAMTTYTYTVRAVSGKVRSSYQVAGISATVIPSDKLTPYVVFSDVKYRTGPSTDYKVLGTFKTGTVVQVISGWSQQASGFTWYRIKVGNNIRYIASDFLLGTPKLTGISTKGSGLTVTWNKVAHASGYDIYRKADRATRWSKIASVSAATLSYTDDSLASGSTYTYTVRATTSSATSRYNTAGLSRCFLTMPKLTSSSASSKGNTINWSSVTGAQGYYIYRKTSGGSWARIAQVNSGRTLSYRDNYNLFKGTTYFYTVRAFSGNSWSDCQTRGLSVTATATLNPVTKTYITTGTLNYRDRPGTNSTVKGTLSSGTKVQVISNDVTTINGTKWFAIYLNSNVYYVSSKYLKEA